MYNIFAQPNSMEISMVHTGVGKNISFDYKINNKNSSYFFGLKFHINKTPYDNGAILGNAQAFNFIEHFGINIGGSHKIIALNDRIRLNAFYHDQFSYLGANNMVYVPRGSLFDSVLNHDIGIYSKEPELIRPGLIIEQNIGFEAKIILSKRISISESFGSGFMLYFNKDEINIDNPGGPNWELIVPFYRVGIGYVFKE